MTTSGGELTDIKSILTECTEIVLSGGIVAISLLGSIEKIRWSRNTDAMIIELPKKVNLELQVLLKIL